MPKKVVDLWRDRKIKLIISEEILKEYLEVLMRFGLSDKDLKEWGETFTDLSRTEVTLSSKKVKVIKDEPADNKFLECALAGRADYIVSGDRHLQKLKKFQRIKILSPSKFYELYYEKNKKR